jgi:glycosyltransferase involved in cell wall biosynthesis
MKLPTIREAGDLRGKRVLLRVDFNVPIDNGVVVDDFRIQEALPTIRFLREAGAHVIIISHLHNRENDSLKPVAKYLQQLMPVSFIGDLDFFHLEGKLAGVAEGECALLENLRHAREEESNNEQFAKNLANLADIYVNEAFSVSHREHASIVGIPKLLPTFVGLRFYSRFVVLTDYFVTKIKKYSPHATFAVIPNGVDLHPYSEENEGYILALGRIEVDQKGLDLLIDAYSKLAHKELVPLVIAGGGTEREVRNTGRSISSGPYAIWFLELPSAFALRARVGVL